MRRCNQLIRNYKEYNMIQKILHYTVDLPLNILRDLTIPPCENYAFNKYFFSLIPLCAPLFILFTTSYFYLLYELYILIGYLVIGSLIGVGLFLHCPLRSCRLVRLVEEPPFIRLPPRSPRHTSQQWGIRQTLSSLDNLHTVLHLPICQGGGSI